MLWLLKKEQHKIAYTVNAYSSIFPYSGSVDVHIYYRNEIKSYLHFLHLLKLTSCFKVEHVEVRLLEKQIGYENIWWVSFQLTWFLFWTKLIERRMKQKIEKNKDFLSIFLKLVHHKAKKNVSASIQRWQRLSFSCFCLWLYSSISLFSHVARSFSNIYICRSNFKHNSFWYWTIDSLYTQCLCATNMS